MQTTLRIDDETFRSAKAEAARRGTTLTRYIEEALRAYETSTQDPLVRREEEIRERNELMEALLKKTAHFEVGDRPTREENNER